MIGESPFVGSSRSGTRDARDYAALEARIRRLEKLYASEIPIDPVVGLVGRDVQAAIAELAAVASEAPALGSGWTNAAAPFGGAAVVRIGSGVVALDGAISGGVDGTVFTLAVGQRPGAEKTFVCACDGGFYRVIVQPDGDVVLVGSSAVVSHLTGVLFVAA